MSSKSLIVKMWWGLDGAAPGEGSGLDSPPAGLLFCGYEVILGRAPRSGLAKTDPEVEFASVEGFVEDNPNSRASHSDWGHGLWAIVQFSP